MHIEKERHTAKEMGIPMPNPTIKPLWTAAGILILMSSLVVMYGGNKPVAFGMMAVGAVMLVGFLYAWLTTPMEDPHH
jgi:cytochrome c oxidase subunit 1